QAIFSAERDCGFGALLGERKEPRPRTTTKNYCEQIMLCRHLFLADCEFGKHREDRRKAGRVSRRTSRRRTKTHHKSTKITKGTEGSGVNRPAAINTRLGRPRRCAGPL